MYLDEAMRETIDFCFTSADMKEYLKSNLIKLSEYQMAKIISGAPIPLEQKLKEFEKLASFHNQNSIKQEEFDDESYSNHIKALKKHWQQFESMNHQKAFYFCLDISA